MTQALETKAKDMSLDLSSLGTVTTMFAASFSKLGIPFKTKVSATVLEDALKGTVKVRPLPVGTSVSGKVDKLCAHFFCLTINEKQAQAGIVVRVTSTAQSRFKLLYFEQDVSGGYGLASQEDSEMADKITSAGMYFLHFQVYRMDSPIYALAMAQKDLVFVQLAMAQEDLAQEDLDFAFSKILEGLQPCEVSELKPGTHLFAVYGDNFFKTATYTIEAVCAKTFEDTTEKLRKIETQMLRKRNEMRQFEEAYRKVDELLKQRDVIHSAFTVFKSDYGACGIESSNTKVPGEESKANSPGDDENLDGKDKSSKKKCKHYIETKVSATVLKDALNGTFKVRLLPIGTSVSGKVYALRAHFFCVTINEQQAQAGIVVRVTSAAQSRFKLLYFETSICAKGGYVLVSQKDGKMTGKITSAWMNSLDLLVYRMYSTVDAPAMANDLKAVFFKKIEWLQPCEVSELKPGTHIFAVYGDNLFKTTTYTIEAFVDTTKKLKEIEAQLLTKRNELSPFVEEYRKIDELLKQRDIIHSTFTVFKSDNTASGSGSCSNTKVPGEESKADNPGDYENLDDNQDKSSKKKWFNLNFNLNLNKSDENASLKEHLLSYDAGDR